MLEVQQMGAKERSDNLGMPRNKPCCIFRILPGARSVHQPLGSALSPVLLGARNLVQTFLRKTATLEGRGATTSRISRGQFSFLWAFNVLTPQTVSSQHQACLTEPVTFARHGLARFLYQVLDTAQPRYLSPFFLGAPLVIRVKLC